ncbi:MAG TPA: hypothetical protein DCO78_10915 [Chitinophagaceae bacterium]|nr:hypothetical protein [Chitinophagaceae bacterium]
MKTIIFIHGNSQSAKIWDNIIHHQAFAGFRTMAINLPGHGGNLPEGWQDEDYTIPNKGMWLTSFLERAQLEEYILVGLSYASNIIGEMSAALGCKGIVLIGPTILGGPIGPEQVLLPNPFGQALMMAEVDMDVLEGWIRTQMLYPDEDVYSQMKMDYLQTQPGVRTTIPTVLANQALGDEIDRLFSFQVPIMVISGREEKNAVPGYLDNTMLAANVWRGNTIIVSDAAHCVHLDQPELFVQLLLAFAGDVFK